MRRNPLLVILMITGVTGCSMLHLNGGRTAQESLDAGLASLASGDRARATEQLTRVYTNHWNEPAGRHALLVLAAAELDPRNPQRRLWAAADISARVLSQREKPAWMEPLGETLYLLSLELGANEERIARAEAERDSAQALPELPGPSFLAQMQSLRAERDSLRRRASNLEQSLSTKEKELKQKEEELERIKKTLKG